MNSKAEFFRLAGSTVVIEYKNKSIITAEFMCQECRVKNTI